MGECWGAGTATFMILGNICTRSCGFCAVKTGKGEELDVWEPVKVAKSIKTMESFTTTPANATRPNILNIVKGIPSKAWPNTAPAQPNGIIAIINNG